MPKCDIKGCRKEGVTTISMPDGFKFRLCGSHSNHVMRRVKKKRPHKLPVDHPRYVEYRRIQELKRREAVEKDLVTEPEGETYTGGENGIRQAVDNDRHGNDIG